MSATLCQITGASIVQAEIKENIKAPHHWPLWGDFTGDRWFPRKKDPWRGKNAENVSIWLRHPDQLQSYFQLHGPTASHICSSVTRQLSCRDMRKIVTRFDHYHAHKGNIYIYFLQDLDWIFHTFLWNGFHKVPKLQGSDNVHYQDTLQPYHYYQWTVANNPGSDRKISVVQSIQLTTSTVKYLI